MSPRQDDRRPDDETLVAYADGQLDTDAAAEVERYLERDPEARHLVELLRKSGELARDAFQDAIETPLPKGLAEMILREEADNGGAERATNVVPFRRPAARASGSGRGRRSTWAVAASLVLVVCGALVMSLLAEREAHDLIAAGPVEPRSELATLLEAKPTGERVRAGEVSITLVATFKDRQLRPCREFESHVEGREDKGMTIGVACRSSAGGWTVVGTAQIAASSGSGEIIKPAGDAVGSLYPGVDALLESVGAGTALLPAEEAALIASGWGAAAGK